MKIAAYVRPWSINYFQYFLPRAFPGEKTFILSDFRGLGDYAWSKSFYKYFHGAMQGKNVPYWLDTEAELEIICRSYLLRSMPLNEASRILRAMSNSIEDMLDAVNPDAFISPSADSYVMDLLIRHCRSRKIPYCGLLPCPFPGYTRATAIGEYTSFRVPDDQECLKSISSIVDPGFQPVDLVEWLKMYGSSYVHLKRSLREIPKRYIYPLIGLWRKDRKNYHYLSSALSSVSFISQALFIRQFFESKWQAKIEAWSGKKIYIPLQAFPESTTDYHVQEIDLIDFSRLLPRLLNALVKYPGALICVKEHPGMMGARPPGFYEEILKFENVVLISGNVPAFKLIAYADVIVTWTGTSALEGVLRGKRAVTMGTPYYSIGQMFRSICCLEDLDQAAKFIAEIIDPSPTIGCEREVANHVLSGTFPGEFRFINFHQDDEELRRDADDLAEGVRKHWDAWCRSIK